MIIEGLLSLIYNLLSLLMTPIDIPDLPSEASTVMSQAAVKLSEGAGILAAFCHYSYIISLVTIIIVIDAALLVWKFIRWILQKIPMAAVE